MVGGHNSIYDKTEETITNVFCCHSLIQKSQERKTDEDEITWGSDELPTETTNHEDSAKGKNFVNSFFHQKQWIEKNK